jgi:hypothetical protein
LTRRRIDSLTVMRSALRSSVDIAIDCNGM